MMAEKDTSVLVCSSGGYTDVSYIVPEILQRNIFAPFQFIVWEKFCATNINGGVVLVV